MKCMFTFSLGLCASLLFAEKHLNYILPLYPSIDPSSKDAITLSSRQHWLELGKIDNTFWSGTSGKESFWRASVGYRNFSSEQPLSIELAVDAPGRLPVSFTLPLPPFTPQHELVRKSDWLIKAPLKPPVSGVTTIRIRLLGPRSNRGMLQLTSVNLENWRQPGSHPNRPRKRERQLPLSPYRQHQPRLVLLPLHGVEALPRPHLATFTAP